ncbi:glycosyltransferase family 4 protein [Parablautia sp. Marseille-Q6255]|uniref:glycosyltransferase family 4 protein n=1 Tax=Parablautia sp. Marseille-Q6255 TaxID=3039593 RepID=UPI0024BC7F09|nr:glycosyltransferase family 4 protein [Parablautia sp. Marseille-Q6255]
MGGDCVKKKKLLVTGSTFPRWKGDTEPRFVLDLSEALTEYFDVTALVPAAPGAKNQEVMNGVKVIRYHYFPIHKWETLCYPGAIVPRIKEKKIRALLVPFLFLSLYWHLFRLLPQFDIVHAHWIIPQGIVQSFFKKPYIVTSHGGDIKALNIGIIKKLKIQCLKKAKCITVVSELLKGEVRKLCDTIEVRVISMGYNALEFGKQHAVLDYFKQGDKKVILFVGRLAEIKGVTYLIEAMKQVDAKLVIVGDGTLKDALKQQAKEQGDKIVFLGAKTHEELKTIYASADIFVAPSITMPDGSKEGFGLVMLEAMASGIPVIASVSGGIASLIHDGENGMLCPEKNPTAIAEKINRLLQDEELYRTIVNNMKQLIKGYDYRVIARQYADILNDRGQE